MKIILASSNPSRKKALDILGLRYKTVANRVKPSEITDDDPYKRAQAYAEAKALAVGKKEKDALVIAACTYYVVGGRILERPKDKFEAFVMLKDMSGKQLNIVAGVAVLNTKTGDGHATAESYRVAMRNLENREIKDYVNRYPVTKLVGAIEEDGILRFAKKSDGAYPFFTGLPLPRLIEYLRDNKINV